MELDNTLFDDYLGFWCSLYEKLKALHWHFECFTLAFSCRLFPKTSNEVDLIEVWFWSSKEAPRVLFLCTWRFVILWRRWHIFLPSFCHYASDKLTDVKSNESLPCLMQWWLFSGRICGKDIKSSLAVSSTRSIFYSDSMCICLLVAKFELF